MKKNAGGRRRLLHLTIGTPDEENCPICKAHAKSGREAAEGDPSGRVLVQELSLHDILRCPCPMCAQARTDSLDD